MSIYKCIIRESIVYTRDHSVSLFLRIKASKIKRSLSTVAYLGFHFGGGGSKFFWKSWGICMARSAM